LADFDPGGHLVAKTSINPGVAFISVMVGRRAKWSSILDSTPISADIDVGGHLVAKTGIKPEVAFICEIGGRNSFSVKLCF
jgi:hypothetical protein